MYRLLFKNIWMVNKRIKLFSKKIDEMPEVSFLGFTIRIGSFHSFEVLKFGLPTWRLGWSLLIYWAEEVGLLKNEEWTKKIEWIKISSIFVYKHIWSRLRWFPKKDI